SVSDNRAILCAGKPERQMPDQNIHHGDLFFVLFASIGLTFIGSLTSRSPEAAQPARAPTVTATRLPQNPLVTVRSSASPGDNIDGPTVIRVPSCIALPLGRDYMYFAQHMGAHIRLPYPDAIAGPWKIYE